MVAARTSRTIPSSGMKARRPTSITRIVERGYGSYSVGEQGEAWLKFTSASLALALDFLPFRGRTDDGIDFQMTSQPYVPKEGHAHLEQ
jgi:hypothetical protein